MYKCQIEAPKQYPTLDGSKHFRTAGKSAKAKAAKPGGGALDVIGKELSNSGLFGLWVEHCLC